MTQILSKDYFFGGRLQLVQPQNGYRVSVDSCLLIYFIHKFGAFRHCVEFGTGNGIISIGLIISGAAKQVTAVEIQELLMDVAKQNVAHHVLEDRLSLFRGDIRKLPSSFESSEVDAVVMNPPFWSVNSGKQSKNEQKCVANHEIFGTLDDWMQSAARILKGKTKGRIYAIYPAKKLNRLIEALRNARYNLLSMCAVHSREGLNAELIMIEARTGNVDNVSILPPIVLNDENGNPTENSNWILHGKFSETISKMPDLRKK